MSFDRFNAVLRDLAVAAPEPASIVEPDNRDGFERVWPIGAEKKVDDRAHQIQEASDLAFAAGRQAASDHYEEVIRDLQHKAEERLAEARRAWASEQAHLFAESVAHQIGDVEQRISDAIAGIVKAPMIMGLQRAALEELVGAVTSAISPQRAARIVVTGREDLVGEIERQLSSRNIACETVVAAGSEVEVRVDDLMIKSQLTPLIQHVEDILR